MNRRSYLKNILILGVSSVGGFSIFKWVENTRSIDPIKLRNKKQVISELSDLIIPSTDTPGAKDAGVENYIIEVLIQCNSISQQRKFLSGIQDVEKYALDEFNKDFLKCSVKEKRKILDHFAKGTSYSFKILNKIERKVLGESFYSKLKQLTVEGYCLSQLGATKGLAYDYIPGSYHACIPLQVNQKSWATK